GFRSLEERHPATAARAALLPGCTDNCCQIRPSTSLCSPLPLAWRESVPAMCQHHYSSPAQNSCLNYNFHLVVSPVLRNRRRFVRNQSSLVSGRNRRRRKRSQDWLQSLPHIIQTAAFGPSTHAVIRHALPGALQPLRYQNRLQVFGRFIQPVVHQNIVVFAVIVNLASRIQQPPLNDFFGI